MHKKLLTLFFFISFVNTTSKTIYSYLITKYADFYRGNVIYISNVTNLGAISSKNTFFMNLFSSTQTTISDTLNINFSEIFNSNNTLTISNTTENECQIYSLPTASFSEFFYLVLDANNTLGLYAPSISKTNQVPEPDYNVENESYIFSLFKKELEHEIATVKS